MASQLRPQDEKREVGKPKLHPSKPVRVLFASLGFIALGLGILGAFLPLFPTTVFILIAAFCFARSSERAHRALLESKHFGPMIRNWQEKRRISPRSKVYAISLVVLSFAMTIGFFIDALYLRVALVVFAILLVLYLYSLPTCPSGK